MRIFQENLVGKISEIALKFKGTRTITIESSLMQPDGHYLIKTFTLTDWPIDAPFAGNIILYKNLY